jgi:hypothetical protein
MFRRMCGGTTLQIGMSKDTPGNAPALAGAILGARYEPNDDNRTDANDELTLVALPMIVC